MSRVVCMRMCHSLCAGRHCLQDRCHAWVPAAALAVPYDQTRVHPVSTRPCSNTSSGLDKWRVAPVARQRYVINSLGRLSAGPRVHRLCVAGHGTDCCVTPQPLFYSTRSVRLPVLFGRWCAVRTPPVRRRYDSWRVSGTATLWGACESAVHTRCVAC
jgi:hypothetical protein